MGWLSVDKYGEYRITESGSKNPLDNLKFWELINNKIRKTI
jgi:hypothetical protein